MAKTTKNRDRVELIAGWITIGVAAVMLVLLVLGMRRCATELSFPEPTQPSATVQGFPSQTAPKPALIPNPYTARDFAYENGYLTCLTGESLLGVDVSVHQGQIDWKKVAEQGVRFAMVRVGARAWGQAGEIFADARWEENLRGAKENGLMTGVYFFSQAISEEEAVEEARFLLQQLDGMELDLPVVFDWEFAPSAEGRTANMTAKMLNLCAVAFCEEIKAAGYTPMVYFNLDLSRRMLDLPLLQNNGYPFWLAHYSDIMTYPYRIQMWQYTSTGVVPGIEGSVDLNLLFLYE